MRRIYFRVRASNLQVTGDIKFVLCRIIRHCQHIADHMAILGHAISLGHEHLGRAKRNVFIIHLRRDIRNVAREKIRVRWTHGVGGSGWWVREDVFNVIRKLGSPRFHETGGMGESNGWRFGKRVVIVDGGHSRW